MDGWMDGWIDEQRRSIHWGSPGCSVVNLPAIQETQVPPPGQEDPLEKRE